MNAIEAKKRKSTCDLCLECPLCFTGLVKRCYNGSFMYACPYCYWDTSNIKFSKPKETDLDILIGQLQERSCSGLLKRMYSYSLNKLKKQEDLFIEEKSGQRGTLRGSITGITDMVKKAMDTGTWSMEKLEESLVKEQKDNEEKNKIAYTDNYINDKENNYFDFQFIATLLGCSLDYIDNNFSKIDSVEKLKENLKTVLDIKSMSTLEQRHSHIIFQNPISNIQFPKFFDIIPQKSKSSKYCKSCKKILVETGELLGGLKESGLKLEISHFFIKQFPSVTIYKIELSLKVLLLKFTMADFGDITFYFREDPDSPTKVLLPPDKYEIGNKDITPNDWVYKNADRFFILNFKFKEEYLPRLETDGSTHILRFFMKVDYNRGGGNTAETIEYPNEIKFKVNNKKEEP